MLDDIPLVFSPFPYFGQVDVWIYVANIYSLNVHQQHINYSHDDANNGSRSNRTGP